MASRQVQLAGSFNGWTGETIVRTTSGEAWQQSEYLYHYHYDFMPRAIIDDTTGQTTMLVSGVPQRVPVMPVSIEVEGVIISDFKGFSVGALFKFSDGQIWQQTDSTHSHQHAHRPEAFIADGLSGFVLSVEDMEETVSVRRVR